MTSRLCFPILHFAFFILTFALVLTACAPRVMRIAPQEGSPGTVVSLSMEYLVGWPRVEMGGHMMDFHQLNLLSAHPDRQIAGEELSWIEDKVLQFRVPNLPPGNYTVTVYDDKGPPGDKIYALLETTAYLLFPPVWPFLFRSNETQVILKVLPGAG